VKGKDMTRRIIIDSPRLLEEAEALISLTKACKAFPRQVSRATLERWLRQGVGGVLLESVRIGGQRFTSTEAIDRFVLNQLHVEHERPAPVRNVKSKKELAEAARRFNLPEPFGTTGGQGQHK